jgi:hypothetical protein
LLLKLLLLPLLLLMRVKAKVCYCFAKNYYCFATIIVVEAIKIDFIAKQKGYLQCFGCFKLTSWIVSCFITIGLQSLLHKMRLKH